MRKEVKRYRVKDKQCFWCGSLDSDNNPVTISEDVPPRWLSGIKPVKESNCVPQCEECKNALPGLDNAVNGYFRFGAEVDLDKVERAIEKTGNKGYGARRINLNGNKDYAQSNGALLLWLRKLLVGLWYKEKDARFDGDILILAPWITFDVPDFYFSGSVTTTEKTRQLLFEIDSKTIGNNYSKDRSEKIPFAFTFISKLMCEVPAPLKLLRFTIYGQYHGYCLYIPNGAENNIFQIYNVLNKAPLYVEYWLRCCAYMPPSFVVKLNETLKQVSAKDAADRVRR